MYLCNFSIWKISSSSFNTFVRSNLNSQLLMGSVHKFNHKKGFKWAQKKHELNFFAICLFVVRTCEKESKNSTIRRHKIQKIHVKVLHTVWHASLTKKIRISFIKEYKIKIRNKSCKVMKKRIRKSYEWEYVDDRLNSKGLCNRMCRIGIDERSGKSYEGNFFPFE